MTTEPIETLIATCPTCGGATFRDGCGKCECRERGYHFFADGECSWCGAKQPEVKTERTAST